MVYGKEIWKNRLKTKTTNFIHRNFVHRLVVVNLGR